MISTGGEPGDAGPGGQRVVRADVFGNLWISSKAPLGYAGVLCFSAQGRLLGRIRLPEVCANLTLAARSATGCL